MAGRVLAKKDDRALAAPEECVDVEKLVRKLVQRVADAESTVDSTAAADRIILDIEMEGVRCVLVKTERPDEKPPLSLSPREQEIARMVAEGYPNKTIAAVLEISSWTVCTHLRRIFNKLGVRSRASMVARLHEIGILSDRRREF